MSRYIISVLIMSIFLWSLVTGHPDVSAATVSGGDNYAAETDSVSGGDNYVEEMNEPSGEDNYVEEINEPGEEDDDVISFQVPSNLNFYMDPYGMINGSQIYSPTYRLCNTDSGAICFNLTNIVCELGQDVVDAPPEMEEMDIRGSRDKIIRLQLCFGDGNVINVTQSPGTYILILGPGESMDISVGGCMSAMPGKEWKDGDAGISMIYTVYRLPEET